MAGAATGGIVGGAIFTMVGANHLTAGIVISGNINGNDMAFLPAHSFLDAMGLSRY